MNEFKDTFSLEQIYLYCLQETVSLNPTNIYQTLTQNRRIPITKIRLEQFLTNIVDKMGIPHKFDIKEKDVYDYDDIIELNLTRDGGYIMTKVLGQKFFIVTNEYPFICDPFNVTEYDPFIERAARKSLSTLNNQLLLNTGPILKNNIYLCLAKDVLEYTRTINPIMENTAIQIYYPF